MGEEKRAKDTTELLSHCKEVKEIMEIQTGNEIHIEIADNSPQASIMTGNEYNQCIKDDNKRCKKRWDAVNDMIKRIEDKIEGFKKYRKGVIRNSQLVKACDCFLNHLKEPKDELSSQSNDKTREE